MHKIHMQGFHSSIVTLNSVHLTNKSMIKAPIESYNEEIFIHFWQVQCNSYAPVLQPWVSYTLDYILKVQQTLQ